MLAFQKTEDANHFIRGQSIWSASAATAEVFRSPEARADLAQHSRCVVMRKAPMPDDVETETLRSFARTEMP